MGMDLRHPRTQSRVLRCRSSRFFHTCANPDTYLRQEKHSPAPTGVDTCAKSMGLPIGQWNKSYVAGQATPALGSTLSVRVYGKTEKKEDGGVRVNGGAPATFGFRQLRLVGNGLDGELARLVPLERAQPALKQTPSSLRARPFPPARVRRKPNSAVTPPFTHDTSAPPSSHYNIHQLNILSRTFSKH